MTTRRPFEYQQPTAEDVERHIRHQQRRQQKRQATYDAYRGNSDRLCEMLCEDDYDDLASYFEAYKPRPRGMPPVDPRIEDMRTEASGRERLARAQNGGRLPWGGRRQIADHVVQDFPPLVGRRGQLTSDVNDLVAYLERGRRKRRRRVRRSR
jgi:hypothetical protein